MAETRTIAVMGATGRQGRGVIDALLYSTTSHSISYAIRPLTRSLDSVLAERFRKDYPKLELKVWRVDDGGESLGGCFEGCYGAFVNSGTVMGEGTDVKTWTREELRLGERIRGAAEKAKLIHLIYPCFPSIFNASNGQINIRHFETKHQLSLQFRASTVPCTILCPGPFYTDFMDMGYTSWEGEKLIFSTPAQPDKRMGWADPGHDIGWFSRAAWDVGVQELAEEMVPVCGQSISYEELASRFSAVTGVKAEYRHCGVEEFGERKSGRGVKGMEAKALGEWLVVAPDGRTCYGTMEMDLLESVQRKLKCKALPWEKFLERTGWRGPPK